MNHEFKTLGGKPFIDIFKKLSSPCVDFSLSFLMFLFLFFIYIQLKVVPILWTPVIREVECRKQYVNFQASKYDGIMSKKKKDKKINLRGSHWLTLITIETTQLTMTIMNYNS